VCSKATVSSASPRAPMGMFLATTSTSPGKGMSQ
jgi:hypothetical protein